MTQNGSGHCNIQDECRKKWFGNGQAIFVRIKIDFVCIKNLSNTALLVWSDIISCSEWRQARSTKAAEQNRKKVNCEIGNFMSFTGGFVVRHNGNWSRVLRLIPSTQCPFIRQR